jgi:hypothetical protein
MEIVKTVKDLINEIENKLIKADEVTDNDLTTEESIDDDLYKCIVVRSNNTDKYFIDIIKTKQPESFIYHNLINRYKLYCKGKIKKYSSLYKLLTYNDIILIILEDEKSYEDCLESQSLYIQGNDGVINNDDKEEIPIVKIRKYKDLKTIDKKLYFKKYYKENKLDKPCYSKEKSKKYYLDNKKERLEYSKSYYKGLRDELSRLQNSSA